MKKTNSNDKTTNNVKNVQENGKVSSKTAKNTVKSGSKPKNCK